LGTLCVLLGLENAWCFAWPRERFGDTWCSLDHDNTLPLPGLENTWCFPHFSLETLICLNHNIGKIAHFWKVRLRMGMWASL
jgi:hypothetical protein